jgi:RNA polymerase sigma-70 factor (ECF subfamily)
MDSYTDAELVGLAQNGHENAFENLLKRYYRAVYGLAFKYCRIKEDAEDITQEVFIILARKLNSYRYRSSFKTWLFRITINAATDFLRKRSRNRPYEIPITNGESTGNPTPSPEEVMEFRLIYEEIDKLPDKQKAALILVLSEGLSHKEASKVLHCSETTVSWRIHRARKSLDKIITGRYEDGR